MTFGERLKYFREQRRMTQEQLAIQIGVAKTTITGYERGNREPDVAKIKKLAVALGISGNELLGLEQKKSSNAVETTSGAMDVMDRINLCLKKIGKSGAEMSRDLGLSNSTYSQWNTRKTKPSNKVLSILAVYLGVSISYLANGREDALLEEQKEKPAPMDGNGLSQYDINVLEWFHALPKEKRQAILALGDAPKELLED